LIHSSAYQPQTDGQIDRVNQIFKDHSIGLSMKRK
jgi:hypothetical protein